MNIVMASLSLLLALAATVFALRRALRSRVPNFKQWGVLVVLIAPILGLTAIIGNPWRTPRQAPHQPQTSPAVTRATEALSTPQDADTAPLAEQLRSRNPEKLKSGIENTFEGLYRDDREAEKHRTPVGAVLSPNTSSNLQQRPVDQMSIEELHAVIVNADQQIASAMAYIGDRDINVVMQMIEHYTQTRRTAEGELIRRGVLSPPTPIEPKRNRPRWHDDSASRPTMVQCPRCHGVGNIDRTIGRNPYGNYDAGPASETCPRCGGSGQVAG